MHQNNTCVPLDVPLNMRDSFLASYGSATKESGNLMLFAGDQKVEHLNDDFVGEHASVDSANPRHLFEIASHARIGAFATQFGLITRYALEYPSIPYVVKVNSKSPLVPTEINDPISRALVDVDQILDAASEYDIDIVGVGYTIYLGSIYESEMFAEASQLIYEAHQNGLFAVLWMYPRGKSVENEKDAHLIAGAAGVAHCLGADFVKVNYPHAHEDSPAEALKEAVIAAGNTKVICAGGASTDARGFFQTLYDQIHIAGASGNATGRNIHQKSREEAVRFCNATYAITVENKSVDDAMAIYEGR